MSVGFFLFDFFDGKIVHQGKIRELGKNGYSVGFASGNIGDGEYVGTSSSDRALKDRMHLILGVDHPLFSTTSFDDFMIFSGDKRDSRASLPKKSESLTSELIQVNKEFQSRLLNPLFPIVGVYLTKGLDYLEETAQKSKKAIASSWTHANVEGVRQDTDEGFIFPLSKRAVLSSQALALSLEFIAEAKGTPTENSVALYLDALKLTVPYSGVLHQGFVDQKHHGDVYSAFDEAIAFSKEQILQKQAGLEEALMFAEAGEEINDKLLKEISPEEGRFSPVVDAISKYAEHRKLNPSESGIYIRDVILKAHETD